MSIFEYKMKMCVLYRSSLRSLVIVAYTSFYTKPKVSNIKLLLNLNLIKSIYIICRISVEIVIVHVPPQLSASRLKLGLVLNTGPRGGWGQNVRRLTANQRRVLSGTGQSEASIVSTVRAEQGRELEPSLASGDSVEGSVWAWSPDPVAGDGLETACP